MRLLVGYTLPGFTGFFITSASLPAWLAAGGIDTSVAGVVTTALLVATVAVQVLVPRLVARWGFALVLAAGLVALGGPALLLLIDGGLWWVVLISLVRGAGFAVLTVLGSTMTARIVSPARRGEAIGIYGLAIAIPSVLAVPGGVALVSAGLFPAVALIGVAPLLALPIVPGLARHVTAESAGATPVPPRSSSGSREARRAAGRAALAPSLVLLTITVVGGGFITFLPIARPQGALATVALLAFGVTGALGRWRVGALADRIGTRRLVPGSSVTVTIGILAVAGGLTLDGGIAAGTIIAGATVLGIGYGAAQNLTLLAAFARAGPREPATVSAIWNVGFDAGTAIGATGVGLAALGLGVPGALAASAVLVAATLPLAVAAGRLPKIA